MSGITDTYNIFVVEDSDVYRSVMIQALESDKLHLKGGVSYNIYGFASGEECLQSFYLKPDLIVMDYLLNSNGYIKNMDGMQLLTEIKNKAPDVDVVVVSCQNDLNVVKKLMNKGITDYVKKEGLGQYGIQKVVNNIIENKEIKRKKIRNTAITGLVIVLAILILMLQFK